MTERSNNGRGNGPEGSRARYAEKWRMALEQGYVRLEMALLEAANDSLEVSSSTQTGPIPR